MLTELELINDLKILREFGTLDLLESVLINRKPLSARNYLSWSLIFCVLKQDMGWLEDIDFQVSEASVLIAQAKRAHGFGSLKRQPGSLSILT
jgi:hypothetical protein